jgi:5-methylcytosine-specific restriction endonuclease McrA
MARGGSNWPSNLQLLCKSCNLSKGARDAEEFMREKGFLL